MTYEQALAYLEGLVKFGSQLGLTRIERLLELMQQPQRRFRSIHVTGTNGKGSTTAMLTAALQAAGLRVGMYTSPHLVSYRERMRINGEDISPAAFGAALAHTRRFVDMMVAEGAEHPTEFEILTAAAFYYFAASGVEYAVIEVGLGGLLDSTNVIMPAAAVITNVTLEHTDRCGTTIAEIAGHKAGIIKPGVPVVTAATGEAREIIRRTAAANQAELAVLGETYHIEAPAATPAGQTFSYRSGSDWDGSYQTALIGRHQAANAALAVRTIELLSAQEPRLTPAAVKDGLRRVVWPGRFERVAGEPTLIIDGAHNPDGARVLRENLDALYPAAPRRLLIGILKDKDVAGILRYLVRPEDRVIVTAPQSDRAGDPAIIAREIVAREVAVVPEYDEAVRQFLAAAQPEEVLCVAGSLYLIGAVRPLILAARA